MPLRPLLALADDDPEHATLLATWLERRGFDVLWFTSGDAMLAWARAEGAAVDALLLDVDMPGRDGVSTLAEMRALPRFAATPAAFVSAAEGVEPRAIAVGADLVIAKDGQVLARVGAWLDERLGSAVVA